MTDECDNQKILEATRAEVIDSDAPALGVHEMSEYIYCSRAGILATETSPDDDGCEFVAAPALGGIPAHEIDELERALERCAPIVKCIGLVFAAAVITVAAVTVAESGLGIALFLGTVAAAGISGRLWWWGELQHYLYCKKRLAEAHRAARREPNWLLNAQHEVHWWELIQSGFDSRELKRALHDPDSHLTGRPWRILQRGDMSLPVLRIHVADYDRRQIAQVNLREQQRARMAAYAYLLFQCERRLSDWGIILFNDSDDGVAVPIGQAEHLAFRNGLQKARSESLKRRDNTRYSPEPPEQGNACKNCPFGRPRRVGAQPTVLGGQELPAFVTEDEHKQAYHCACGDRFRWVPPHQDASALGLTD